MVVEWIYFFFFIGLPSLSLCISLLTGTNDFWAFTSLIWFCSVLVFFAVFAYNIIYYEIRAAFEVIKNKYDMREKSWFEVVKQAIYLRQVATYGGYKSITVVSMGALTNSEHTDDFDEKVEIPGTRETDLSWRAKLTAYQGFLQANMYEILENPEMIYTVDDARDVRPFITRYGRDSVDAMLGLRVVSLIYQSLSSSFPGTRGRWRKFSVGLIGRDTLQLSEVREL